ncbi:hypothetical protein [Nonomuraea africana]|uniref:hypothetical protein n=1 Tax=Nonomuraea africana TaxID=46171 RepID=UPI0033C30765
MNPWQEVVERIEAGENNDLVEFLSGLGELGRRAVAVQLPGYLAGRLEVADRAAGFRLAGAACLGGAPARRGRGPEARESVGIVAIVTTLRGVTSRE